MFVVAFICICSEIKSLRVRQRFEGRSKLYDWLFSPPTLQEIISWQINFYNVTGRLVGIYPELKHPDWHRSLVSIVCMRNRHSNLLQWDSGLSHGRYAN
jgi:hypothetical protein